MPTVEELNSGAPVTTTQETINAALQEPTSLEFINTPLPLVLQSIEKAHKIPVEIDEEQFKAAGLDPQMRVSCNVVGVKLSDALDSMLSDLMLRYVIRDGRLVVVPAE